MQLYYLKRFLTVIRKEGLESTLRRILMRLSKEGHFPDQNRLYSIWIEKTEKAYLESARYLEEIQNFKIQPKISILMPVYNVDPDILEEAIESIEAQWYKNWELCLYDDASKNPKTLEFLGLLQNSNHKSQIKYEIQNPKSKTQMDPGSKSGMTHKTIKIKFGKKNLNISGATNEAFIMATGQYVMLMDNDDVLRPHALYEIAKAINLKPDLDLIYFDEDKLDKFGQRIEPWFKPDFSPELMWSMMYPTHAVYSRKIFEKAGKMRIGYEGSQDYDLCLRVMEITDKIHHIPWVLYSWRKVEGSTADNIKGKSYALVSAKNALEDAIKRRGLKGRVANDYYPFVVDLEPKHKDAKVEIIIPTKDNLKYLKRCIDSIILKTKWKNYQITIVDNNSNDSKTLDYLDKLKKDSRFKILEYALEFNFSAINNYAASRSNAKFLLFLNNDTKVITDNWLTKLVAWAEQKQIGAVGAKLLYPDKTIQHAGIVMGVGGVANHAYYKMPDANEFYFNHLHCIKNYLAVTGACLMIERQKFEKIGGFNTSLPHSYNDVELCLEFVEEGFRNVYLPKVELIHYESKSRNPEVRVEEDEYMYKRWSKYIEHDPYYNPNLNKDLSKGPIFSLSS